MVSESVSVNMDQFNDKVLPVSRIGPGDALTQWEMTDAEERPFAGKARPMPDRVNYCFKNGWVDTGDLPCREALLQALPGRTVDKPVGPFRHVHWGTDGEEVDYSSFKHRPTLVRRGFRCGVRMAGAGVVRFRLSTCGGVNLWLNDTHVAAFEPFERNNPKIGLVEIEFPDGDSELTLLLEDLHERDTTFFFSMTHVGGPEIETFLSTGVDAARLATAAATFAALRVDHIFATSGTVRLICDGAPSEPLEVTVSGPLPFLRGGLSSDPSAKPPTRKVTLGPGTLEADAYKVSETIAGCLALDLSVEVQDVTLSRRLGVTNLPNPVCLSGHLEETKAQAAGVIADAGNFDPSVAALLAARGEADDLVERIVEAALTTIEERYDCSDFSILPLLRLWRDFPDRLPPALRNRLREAFLGYRYWLDAPGNDVMWFWSENHVLCFHTAQLVAGMLFPDTPFPTHGKTGREMAAEAEARLTRWFDAIDRDGLCEWNSAAYYPIDFLGLITLHDMAPSLRARAKAVLDRIFIMVGLHTTGGVPAGTQGRAYEKELLAGPVTELGTLAAIAFGGDFWPGHDRAAALFCLSDYAPPAICARFARPEPGQTLSARYTQGYGHDGKLTLWKSPAAQLSTVTELKTGEKGHQAHVIDVQFAAHPMARLWINHPGELKVWGERRPSLLAGNHVMPAVVQHGPTAMMIYDLDRDWTDLRMTQLFAPPEAFDRIEPFGDWLVFASGAGQAAVWCSTPLTAVDGLYKDALHRARADKVGWVICLAQPAETEEMFLDRLSSARPVFNPKELTLDVRGPGGDRVSLTFGGPMMINGRPQDFNPLSTTPHIGFGDAPLTAWRLPDD